MKSMKYLIKLTYQAIGSATLVGFIFLSVPQSTEAKRDPQSSIQNKQDSGQVAGRYRGGGTFGTCPEVKIPLTALSSFKIVPIEGSSSTITYVGGVTVLENPTLWFYIPPELNANLVASFELKDANGKVISKISSTDPAMVESDGIVSVSTPSLEIGQVYEWYFMVYCDVADQEVPIYVNGGIQRIPLDPQLAGQLASLSPLEQAEHYRQNRLWYDAITILGNLRRDRPTDTAVEAAWDQLLQDISITDIP